MNLDNFQNTFTKSTKNCTNILHICVPFIHEQYPHLSSPFLQEFVVGLSVLARGTLTEKLHWAFTLYDINKDGMISKQEMLDIISAIYDLMGRYSDPSVDEHTARGRSLSCASQASHAIPATSAISTAISPARGWSRWIIAGAVNLIGSRISPPIPSCAKPKTRLSWWIIWILRGSQS